MKCFSCGADKDLNVETVYPYPEDECLCDEPIPQLLTIECQGNNNEPSGSWDFRMAVMCHDCWHRLETNGGIDMWIGEECWKSLNPLVPFARLPEVKDIDYYQKWKAENYEELK